MASRNTNKNKMPLLPFSDTEMGELAKASEDIEGKPAPTVCVFCGSSPGNDPAYAEAARRFGTLIAENKYRLLFGGGGLGLMGEVARAARAGGAPVIGILPAFLRHLEPPLEFGEKVVITPDLQQRKARMIGLSDAFVLLSGGLGTFDEFFEVITTAQLAVHKKPIVVVDTLHYFAPLQALLEHIVARGFAKPQIASLYTVVATPDEAMDLLTAQLSVATH
jgi:uncharacterized protein (TIGR00730 family)